MTIEFSLRRRASHSRCLGILWLSLAIIILISTYTSLPFLVDKTLSSVRKLDGATERTNSKATGEAKETKKPFLQEQLFAMTTLILGTAIVSFACYLLGRSAFIEIELAARFSGLADALCIAGNDFTQLEKAATILVPKPKFLSVPDSFSAKDLKPLVDFLKQLR